MPSQAERPKMCSRPAAGVYVCPPRRSATGAAATVPVPRSGCHHVWICSHCGEMQSQPDAGSGRAAVEPLPEAGAGSQLELRSPAATKLPPEASWMLAQGRTSEAQIEAGRQWSKKMSDPDAGSGRAAVAPLPEAGGEEPQLEPGSPAANPLPSEASWTLVQRRPRGAQNKAGRQWSKKMSDPDAGSGRAAVAPLPEAGGEEPQQIGRAHV